MEFKNVTEDIPDDVILHINRITVEFKGLSVNIDFPACGSHINRITVEFKVLLSGISVAFAIILIESQWNLKQSIFSAALLGESILIESQWNLKNAYSNIVIQSGNNINRITVEFKANYAISNHFLSWILIESQWNLKSSAKIQKHYCLHINRITVEFKASTGQRRRFPVVSY